MAKNDKIKVIIPNFIKKGFKPFAFKDGEFDEIKRDLSELKNIYGRFVPPEVLRIRFLGREKDLQKFVSNVLSGDFKTSFDGNLGTKTAMEISRIEDLDLPSGDSMFSTGTKEFNQPVVNGRPVPRLNGEPSRPAPDMIMEIPEQNDNAPELFAEKKVRPKRHLFERRGKKKKQ